MGAALHNRCTASSILTTSMHALHAMCCRGLRKQVGSIGPERTTWDYLGSRQDADRLPSFKDIVAATNVEVEELMSLAEPVRTCGWCAKSALKDDSMVWHVARRGEAKHEDGTHGVTEQAEHQAEREGKGKQSFLSPTLSYQSAEESLEVVQQLLVWTVERGWPANLTARDTLARPC
eukprot:1167307-Amphidinium_carterae.1